MHGETDGTRSFGASIRSRTLYPGVVLVVEHVTVGATTVAQDFENAKIESISDCRATAGQRMVKRVARGDSAHRIDLERSSKCLAECS